MFSKLVLIAVVGMMVTDDKPKDEKAKKDQDAIQGAWKVASTEQGGVKSETEGGADVVITMKGDGYTVKMNGQEIEEGTFKLDHEKKPKTIDFKITKGNDKGKNQQGIYSLEGDMLRICVTQPEKDDRPKELSAKDGTEHILFVMKRDKK